MTETATKLEHRSIRSLRQRFATENPRSLAESKRLSHLLAGGVNHDVRLSDPFPLVVSRAAGSKKWDIDGHEIVCYLMGHGSLLLGHQRPEVVEAVRHQAELGFHLGACHELEGDWAELVRSLVPSAERLRFTSTGTEASLLALRLARAVTGRKRILKLAGHFHGWHDQVAFGSDPPFYGPDSAGIPEGLHEHVAVAAPEATVVAAELEKGDVAALILEPSGASWGAVPLPEGFLQAVRASTTATGTLLIFDEVITGFRWSPGGAQGIAGVRPDMTLLGKILAGGMPGGCVAGTPEALSPLAGDYGGGRVKHFGTHNAHPLSAAAGIATLGLVATGEPGAGADAIARELRAGLNEVLERRGIAGSAYGETSTFHLLIGSEKDPATASTAELKGGSSPELSSELYAGMLLEGVHLMHGSGFLSSAHDGSDVERTVRAFDKSLAAVQQEGLV